MKLNFLSLLLMLGFFNLSAQNTVMDIIANSNKHNTLEAAINAAGLNETLSGPGPFTVFAPTDKAFNDLPPGTVEALLNDIPTLTNILLYHVAGDSIVADDLSNNLSIPVLNNSSLLTTITVNGAVYVNNARITVTNLIADNGVVHIINCVMIPTTTNTVMDYIVQSKKLSTLEAALTVAGLDDVLRGDGPFTVFAPSNKAFNALPPGTVEALLSDIPRLTDILLYHTVGGELPSVNLTDGFKFAAANGDSVTVTVTDGRIFINQARVSVADVVLDNGIIHIITEVILPPTPFTVMDIVENSPNHNILEAAINAADLDGALNAPGTLTVFAPTDAAFAALPAGTVEALLGDIPALTNILLYHVAGITALSGDLTDGQLVTTLNGSDVTVTINGDGVFINDAQVIVADLVADNGVVHVINAVLLPPAPVTTVMDIIENSADHNILETAINAAGLNETLSGPGTFTVFAPTDDAFAALPPGTVAALLGDIPALTNILLYHVAGVTALSGDLTDGQLVTTLNGSDVTVTINGDGVFINDAQVIVADLVADNGVVHVINAVLLPPPPVTTVMDIIENSADHNTLEAAIVAAGLDGTLSGPGTFTVFAPTDAAFAALPAGTVEALLGDIPALTNILLYHVAGVTALSGDLTDGQLVTTLNGSDVTVTINGDGVFINDAQVIVADLVADNGVVHVINAVLLPPTPVTTVMDIIENSVDHNILEAAINAAGLNETLSGPGTFTVFAPTDDAFAALPPGTVAALLGDIPALTNILLYHVAGITALSGDLTDGQLVTTLNGSDVTVTINGDGVFINDAQVIVADLVADNGVVHVINAVLLPPPPAANFGSDNSGVAVNSTINAISGLYPVPTTERLFVSNTEAIEYTFQVTDFNGRVLKMGYLNGDNSIEVSDLLPGVYTLILKHENTISAGRFIKN